jgi:RNA polymerase sigma-70 factor (ECF subfamily)
MRRIHDMSSGVVFIPFVGGDVALARAIAGEHPGAALALYDRYGDLVDRLLTRLLGDRATPDLVQEVFLRALATIDELEDPQGLGTWLVGIVVALARRRLAPARKRRQRGRRLPTPAGEAGRGPSGPLLGAAYEVLDRLSVDQRIVFVLRVVDGMSLVEIAAACRVSVRRARRRLARAEARFLAAARAHRALAASLGVNDRWTIPSRG